MKTLLSWWDRFFFQPQTARVLGVFRIAIGLLTLYSYLLFAKDTTTFFSDEGLLTVATLKTVAPQDGVSVLTWIRDPWGVKLVLATLLVAGACFTVGFQTRLSTVLLFVLVVSFQRRNGLVQNSGDAVLRTMLFSFLFAPAGAAYSLDRLRRERKQPAGTSVPPALVFPWAQRMMQIQIALIYLTTAIAKSRGDLYRSGDALYYVFGLVDFNVHGIEQLMNYPALYKTLSYGTLGIEFALPLLLWWRYTRPLAIALGVLLHLWIMVCMTMPVFGILMIATYLCFLTEDEFDRLLGWLRVRIGRADVPASRRPEPRNS